MHCKYSTWVADSLTKYDSFPIFILSHLQIPNQKSKLDKTDPKTEGNTNLLDLV